MCESICLKLTFLNRASRVELGLISTNLIRAYYERAFKGIGIKISDEYLDRAALATHGFPYLMQLIGYYLIQYTPDGGTVDAVIMDKAERSSMGDMENNVFKPILNPLSDNDKFFLRAMAKHGDTVSTAKLKVAMGKRGPALQPYRKRLLESGVIEDQCELRFVAELVVIKLFIKQNFRHNNQCRHDEYASK